MDKKENKIAVLNFSSDFSHIIAQKIRKLGVYSDVFDSSVNVKALKKYKGIILFGKNTSVYSDSAPHLDKDIFNLSVPILGIAYGYKIMQYFMGADILRSKNIKNENIKIKITNKNPIFKNLGEVFDVEFSNIDKISKLASGFKEFASSDSFKNFAVFNSKKNLYGLGFIPNFEDKSGLSILENFINECSCDKKWNMKAYFSKKKKEIKSLVRNKKVFFLLSNNINSLVCFVFLNKVLGEDNVYAVLIDTGFLFFDDAKEIQKPLSELGFNNFHIEDKKDIFLNALENIYSHEEKLKIFNDLFLQIKEDIAEELNINPKKWIVAKDTAYLNTINKKDFVNERQNKKLDLENVLAMAGDLINPLSDLYKDEIIELGGLLGLGNDFFNKDIFLSSFLLSNIFCFDKKTLAVNCDFNVLNKNIKVFLENKASLKGVKAEVLPINISNNLNSHTKHSVVISTKTQSWNLLTNASRLILSHFIEIANVFLLISGDIKKLNLNSSFINKERLNLLHKVNNDTYNILKDDLSNLDISNFSIFLLPIEDDKKRESVVLSPISSTFDKKISFSKIDLNLIVRLREKIMQNEKISHLFYDLTGK